ncbi:MAG: hypothetical protein ACOZJX_18520 [Pseudomonadota bacterium]
MSTLTHPTPLHATRGRAASLKQVVEQRAGHLLQQLWEALEAYGQRRAAPYLRQQADRLADSNPVLAQELRKLARA